MSLVTGIFLLCVSSFLHFQSIQKLLIARVVSINSFVFSLSATGLFQFQDSTEDILSHFSVFQIGGGHSQILFHDPLCLFWIVLSSGVTSFILLRMKASADVHLSTGGLVCLLSLLCISQIAFLASDGLIQWMLLGLTNWLFTGFVLLSSAKEHSLRPRVLINLTLSDFFWMLGLLGIYFITGTLQIPFLTQPGAFNGLSELATALLTTAILSLLASLVIRLGMFPMMTWSNDCLKSELGTLSLLIFPTFIGGFLFLRWQPLLTIFPEPRTLLIGLSGLSAILLPISGLFLKGRKRLVRLMSVPIAFVAIGVAADPRLWPQLAALFAGSLILSTTLLFTDEKHPHRNSIGMKWAMIVLLLCGTTGIEAVFQALLAGSGDSSVHIPPVMLPLMVLSLGLFVFGLKEVIAPQIEKNEQTTHTKVTMGLLLGVFAMGCVSLAPFFLVSGSSFVFLPPLISVPVVAGAVLVSIKLPAQSSTATPELGSLVRICLNDYYLETILERGIVIPLETAASLMHLFDKYVLQTVMTLLPGWFQREVSETSQLIEQDNSTARQVRLMVWTTVVLIVVVILGK